ncbi:mitochondrial 54S ribosomal protein YmL23 [Eremomyces bilateralis CBS 781.70]|uniref:Large ribosomal subunit protein uL13m n=1 Tax=Eremomyces bilateralis CBS 781.70 TaxID=1392243 RepID=A0A6G1G428_9PEZI|nr:mitochondrial 54S ribosomal protein YmL23 [Eremomyces bilateralis CBS 781.70]KAF1812855.1 mitochondrial 54S ribosomal protein YmL23 [Eremomyces bilateralis CBS 781.70]
MSQVIGQTRLAYSRPWHHLPLTRHTPPLGRVASRIAILLMGKHKPIYDPSTDCGDYVVVTNCRGINVTGRKKEQKLYYSHTTRPGTLKSMAMGELMEKWGGGEILRRAVRGMLPKNRLRDVRMGRLKVFEGDAHPYKKNILHYPVEQNPSILDTPSVKETLAEAKA